MKIVRVLMLCVSLAPVFNGLHASVYHGHNVHHHCNRHSHHCHNHCSSGWRSGFGFNLSIGSPVYHEYRPYYPERRVIKRTYYERPATYRKIYRRQDSYGRRNVYKTKKVVYEPTYETVRYEPATYVEEVVVYRKPDPIRLITDFAGAIIDMVSDR